MTSPVISPRFASASESLYTDERSFIFSIDDESTIPSHSVITVNSTCSTDQSNVIIKSIVSSQSEKYTSQNESPSTATETTIQETSNKYESSSRESSRKEEVETLAPPNTTFIIDNVLDTDWFIHQKRQIEKKLFAMQKLKKERLRDEKANAAKLERTLPMDLLAFDWFNENSLTSELRVYLIDKLLPTLILGMEKVLMEAEKRGLVEEEMEESEEKRKFNPINLLAQYLMRNNPRCSNFPEASPYVRGLRKVSEELRRDVYQLEANKLAKLKMQAQKKRGELEERERRKEEDAKERARLLKLQFSQWLVDSGKLQLQLIQNALYSYLEISSHLASERENVIQYSKELEATDETGITLTVENYIKYMEEYVCDMTMAEFIPLLHHLDQCAFAFRRTFEHEVWRGMFTKLFEALDSEISGYVDRHRMLHLLEKFWDKMEEETKNILHNPRKWPVIELEELDDLYPDSEDESDESVNVSTEDIASSEWASVPMSTYTEAKEEEEDQSTSVEEHGSGDHTVVEEEKETPSSVDEGTSPSPKEDVGKKEESGGDLEEKNEEDDVSSVKVPSAAGDDVIIPAEESHIPPVDVVATEEEEQDDTIDEDTATEEPVVTEEDAITDDVEPLEKKEAEDAVPVETEDIEAVDTEDTAGAEAEKTIEVPPVDETLKTDEEVEIKNEVPQTEDEKQMTEVSEVMDKKTEDKSQTRAAEKQQHFTGSTSLTATLITPAPSTDGSIDVGPVNIQFSKQAPLPNVRKTTTYTTVQRKKPQPEVETEKVWGNDPVVVHGTPIKVGERDPEENVEASQEKVEKTDDTDQDTDTVATTLVGGSEAVLIQHTADDMRADDYYLTPMEVKTRPASASRMSVTFAAEPLILPDRPSAEFFSHYSSRSQSRMTSVFDENQLNQGRFVSLLENFVSDETTHDVVELLINFIHGGYVETEEEKMSRLARARREVLSAKHKQMVDNLFNKWDNDGQGHVDNEEVDDVLSKYKNGMESSALKRGRQAIRQLRKNAPYHDRRRLNRREFHVYINSVCEAMTGGEEVFDGLVEYATGTVERTYAERVRGDARRKWLTQIQQSAETGGASMESVYRAVFQTLYKDADAHGNQKKVSAYISLLEHNVLHPHRGHVLLRYVGCTPDNAPYMLGKAFYEDMKGISFYAVRRGKLVHVPRVQSHGRIYFWNTSRQENEREGSLVLVPLRDARRRTYGLIGIDNVDNTASADRSIFASHEINFYQGIAKGFSNAFHHVDLRRKLLRIVDAAMSWIHSRAPRVRTIVIYFVEPDPKSQVGHVLRKMMTADNSTGVTTTHTRPLRLYRKDNLFRDYLFKCMENSETTSADAYGERHTAYPLRDDQGRCQCVIDISIGQLRSLPRHEFREVQRMLKLLQAANREVMKESLSGEKTVVLEAEERGSDEARVDIMFDRLMLTDLRENVSKLDNSVFAELKNYKIPPPMIHKILKSVLMLFHHDIDQHKEFDDWVNCKQLVTGRLRQRILTYDPTAEHENGETEEETDFVVQSVGKHLKGIPHGAVARHGSRPAQQLYNWAFVCLSLIEHAKKMRQNDGQPAVTPVTSASTNTTNDSTMEPA